MTPDFRLAPGAADDAVTFEYLAHVNGGIDNPTARTLVLRSIGARVSATGRGKLFLEDVAGDELVVGHQRVFARQLNIENQGTHLANDGGDVWVLGYKTERGGTLVDTRAGGRTEVLGGFSYTTTAGKLAPMFANDNSSVFAYFGEVCYSGDPFRVLVRETRGNDTRTVDRGGRRHPALHRGGQAGPVTVPPVVRRASTDDCVIDRWWCGRPGCTCGRNARIATG